MLPYLHLHFYVNTEFLIFTKQTLLLKEHTSELHFYMTYVIYCTKIFVIFQKKSYLRYNFCKSRPKDT